MIKKEGSMTMHIRCDACGKDGQLIAGNIVCDGFFKVELFASSYKQEQCTVVRIDICQNCLDTGNHNIELKKIFEKPVDNHWPQSGKGGV